MNEENLNKTQEEIAQMMREGRRYTILQRERAITEAQRVRNRNAIAAGIYMLGAAITLLLSGPNTQQLTQLEIEAIHSWEAFKQYFQSVPPSTTMFFIAGIGHMFTALRNSRRMREAQHQLDDFYASLENNQELGGNDNARTR